MPAPGFRLQGCKGAQTARQCGVAVTCAGVRELLGPPPGWERVRLALKSSLRTGEPSGGYAGARRPAWWPSPWAGTNGTKGL